MKTEPATDLCCGRLTIWFLLLLSLQTILSVQFLLHLIQRSEKPVRSYHRPKAEAAQHVPPEHMLPGCMRTFYTQFCCLLLQFFRNPGHPDQRINKQIRYAQQVCLPIRPDLMSENEFQLILKSHRHIYQEKQTGCKEVCKAEPEAGPVCMFKFHMNTVLLSLTAKDIPYTV